MKDEPCAQMSSMIRTIAPSCLNLKTTSGDAKKTVQTDNTSLLQQILNTQSNRVLGCYQVLTMFLHITQEKQPGNTLGAMFLFWWYLIWQPQLMMQAPRRGHKDG